VLSPLELLEVLKETELAVGRTEIFRNGPRVVDIDIIFYDDLVVEETVPDLDAAVRWDLTIPHASMLEREFVLRPLAE
jgi:dihydroneopterin aldolase/2-amino-4-hydroxy-6-hydroxymethyldihydropteridine diphosphokinase/dihydropteroate synthase